MQYIHKHAVKADMRQHYDVRVEQDELTEEEPIAQQVESEPADVPEAKRQRVQ